MLITASGHVGIGTTTPTQAKFCVYGSAGSYSPASWFNRTSSNYGGNSTVYSLSIFAQEGIVAGNYIAASDRRIKDNIVDVDDGSALETLRLLKPKRYTYRDVIGKGEEPVWGFISQEVKDTLPYATQLMKNVIPNIYELANVSQLNVITFTNFNTSNLESNATTVIKTTGIDGQEHIVHLVGNVIVEITTTILTPEEYEALEDKSGCVANITGYQNVNVVISVEEYNGLEDTTGYEEVIENYTKTTTIYPGTQLFVYGQEIDDYLYLKKDAIWTVATAALQEVDRQQQADKLRIAELETQLASVLARLDALENTPN
jgi:hypothetical protein